MDIKSKSTDVFKGLISWLCLLLILCGVTAGVAFLLTVIIHPENASPLAAIFEGVQKGKPLPESILFPALSCLALFLAALVFVFLFRRDRRQFELVLSQLLAKIWVEVKLLFLIGAFLLCFFLSGISTTDGTAFLMTTLMALVVLLYLLCLDIGHNRRFFRHNIIHSLLKAINSYQEMTTFQQRSLRRLSSCLAVITAVCMITAVCVIILLQNKLGPEPFQGFFLFAICTFSVASVVGTILWYTLALKRDLQDWNVLMAQIREMYEGNLNAVNHVPPTSNLYDCAMQLNMIRTGIEKAVEEGTKADRTKVELITNVSHDIKTPLTSIVSYIELLKKEKDLPPHVVDYITTISRKAERLSNIVQDVFEVSKAATGNITLNLADLDIGKLLRQTLAEMEETIQNSQLVWRIDIPEYPILVHSDGQRMYRVFQNLIRNCTQYALEGSRAYVTVKSENGVAQVSIRNVSRNEITMDSETLTARFVRGDQNRTTEGSGLGLSIAKSFTEACGGAFTLRTDGDLFLVTVQFPQVPGKPKATPAVLPEQPVPAMASTPAGLSRQAVPSSLSQTTEKEQIE